MQRSRAFRRHQFWRAIARAKRFLKIVEFGKTNPEIYNRNIHLYAKDRKPCSCWMCRNEKYRDHERNESKVLCRNMLEEWQADART